MQVLMDEAGLTFDHIDATSGSVFNLAQLLSGRSATQVAQAWADLAPREFVSFQPWYRYLTFWRLPSILTQDKARRHILPKWGIDLDRIRACTEINGHPVVATFNVCDFNTKRVVTFESSQMDVERLLAVDAVPGVEPPVAADGTLYVDAMLLQDANVTEAVRRGADEIWVIWTVEERSPWKGGFWNHFGHIFEICAVGNLYRQLDAIATINAAVAAGTAAPGQRPVTVHVLKPDQPIPVQYLWFRNSAQMRPVIEAGRQHARRYLASLGASTSAPAPTAP
jgi:predicted patatin/cPLA2 family phospholipase